MVVLRPYRSVIRAATLSAHDSPLRRAAIRGANAWENERLKSLTYSREANIGPEQPIEGERPPLTWR